METDLHRVAAICGIDCFNCEFYETNIDGFFETLDPARKAGFDARGMTKELLKCQGCRLSGCKALPGECETKECAHQQNVEFCHECGDFPCVKLQPLADGAARYPHNLKVFHLMTMKTKGLEAWAREASEIRRRYFQGSFKIGAGPQG